MTTRRRLTAGLAAGLLALSAVSCADDGIGVSSPSTTPAPTTTESQRPTTSGPSTTIAPTTTVSPTTVPPTVPPPTAGPIGEFPFWTAACTEQAGDPAVSYETDEALVAFTTLGGAPTLDLTTPEVMTSAGPYGSIAGSSPIPGGVLVGVYPPDGWPTPDEVLFSSSLTAVDHDGSIRWRRCFEEFETRGFVVAPAAVEPTTAWVVSTAWNEPLEILGVDLTTGADVSFPLDISALGLRGQSDRMLVVGAPLGGDPLEAGDQLTVIDTLDGSSRELPIPPSWVGGTGGWVEVLDDDPTDDEFVIVDHVANEVDAVAVYADGAWTDDPAVLRALLPLQATETFGEPFELRLFDGAGGLVWTVPDFHSVSREGFHMLVADSVVLAMRCVEWDADGYCGWTDDQPPTEELVAFDIETGRQLWTADGSVPSPVVVGDVGILFDRDAGADGGYVLVDLVSGERIGPDGDPWPAGSFVEECCGGDVYTHVERSGGMVIATDRQHVRIWFPPEFTEPTVSVDLGRAPGG